MGPQMEFAVLGLKDEPVDLAKAAMKVDTQAMRVISGGGPGGPAAGAASAAGPGTAVAAFALGATGGSAIANAAAALTDLSSYPDVDVGAVLAASAATIVGQGASGIAGSNSVYGAMVQPDSNDWMPAEGPTGPENTPSAPAGGEASTPAYSPPGGGGSGGSGGGGGGSSGSPSP